MRYRLYLIPQSPTAEPSAGGQVPKGPSIRPDGEGARSAPPDNSPTEATPAKVPAGTNGAMESDVARAKARDGDHGRPTVPAPERAAAFNAAPPGRVIELDAPAYAAGNTCVQCGLCLPACPTYLETGNEADSPRGRIRQMLGLHDGDVPYTAAGQEHLDRCLDCRSCETACPSGVQYHKLIEDARYKLEKKYLTEHSRLPSRTRFQRWLFFNIFTRPDRLRWTMLPGRILQKLHLYGLVRAVGLTKLLPGTLRKMERMLPERGPVWPHPLPPHARGGGMDLVVKMLNPNSAAEAERAKVTVGFFEGCVAAVMANSVHHKAAELLCQMGADVVSPPAQVCCGAIHHHNNEHETARAMARQNIDVYLPEGGPEPDYIITCTAGDGAMLRQYGEILADDPHYAEKAARFSAKVRDVSEVLLELGPPRFKQRLAGRVTYHDACHLAHGQRVTAAPRKLLQQIPGLELVELPESDICCGAAGTYNLTQPVMASALAERKLDRVKETGCEFVVSGNIGCTLHLRAEAAGKGHRVKIVHPVELLHEAVFGVE